MATKSGGRKYTRHFSYREMVHSQTAVRRGIDNTPGQEEDDNLYRVAVMLEQVRALVGGLPVSVSSGYRCKKLNTAIGGAKFSDHIDGRAADFNSYSYGSAAKLAALIAGSKIKFDKLIYEGGWVHVSIPKKGQCARRLIYTAIFKRRRAVKYVSGIVTKNRLA